MSATPQVARLIYACYQCNESKNNQIPKRFACPSCLSHFGDTEDFRIHVAKHTKQTNATTIILNKRSNINSVQVFSSKIGPSRAEIPAERATELNYLAVIGQREALLTNRSTLRQYPFLAIFIQDAIKEDIDTLPLFIWSYSTHNAAPHELKLIRAANFMFTRFVDTCTSAVPPSSTSKRDYERTFWVRYIVPIFETFSNQTGLLQMNWCEIPTLSTDEDKLVDGMGYDHWGFERVALEGSSGLSNASSDKVIDDATKQISTSISMMKRIASHHLNSDVQSFINTKVYGIQSVNSTVILSEIRFLVDGKNRWPKIFEILCYLEMELQKQKLVYEIMENEEQGLIAVLPANSLKNNKLPTDIE
ncbi:hypothetical protein [Parasitella parasitica]|uniref:C2H2-type domain-containing protein n=1 Tax=Parasitella parasitica TaxID=35722 RepID=A0A0B7NIU2_9FUNG|nr:hypothetical protein [Parasitella parasitica]